MFELNDQTLRDLPIFPLPQVVLFPGAILPLHIFEPRYRAMLKDAIGSHRLIIMANIRDVGERGGSRVPAVHSIAGLGAIIEHQEIEDGRSNILLQGIARVHIEELPFLAPYRRARATPLTDGVADVSNIELSTLIAAAKGFASALSKDTPLVEWTLPQGATPNTVADLCAYHLVADSRAKQRLLEELDVRLRVRQVTAELVLQSAHMSRKPEVLN